MGPREAAPPRIALERRRQLFASAIQAQVATGGRVESQREFEAVVARRARRSLASPGARGLANGPPAQDSNFERAAVKWLGRFIEECSPSLLRTQVALAALSELRAGSEAAERMLRELV